MAPPRVLVIGAGIGGLACATELARHGCEVLLLEGAASAGGKMREVEVDAARFDAGPTVLTMRWVFEALFADAGASLESALGLRRADVLARHAWREGERLDLHADLARSADAIARFAGPAEAARYRAFCERARRVYETLEGPFLCSARPSPVSLTARAGLRRLPGLLRIAPFATLWSTLGEHFHDPRLRQLFGRYATYCGSSPYLAPATLMLVAHVERAGVWLVEGGMQRLAETLVALAQSCGVRLRLNAPVQSIEVRGDAACGVRLADGERLEAEAVVFAGDAAALSGGLLGEAARGGVPPPAARSLSALTWHLLARTRGFALSRHNVFFGADYGAEFDALFARSRVPDDPTVYVCAQDRGAFDDDPDDRSPAAGPERLMCLVNAPAGQDDATLEIERCRTHMLRRLERCGLRLEPASPLLATTPAEFARRFPGSRGALYGEATHGWQASFRRPGSRTRLRGLYLAGGTMHPGPGVPMAALSGRLAARALLEDRRTVRVSTSRLHPAATGGGTSTR